MDVQPERLAGEVKRLQRCINDLVSVLALPAMWTGEEPSQIAATLVHALQSLLPLQFVYVRLNRPGDAAAVEQVWISQAESPIADAAGIGEKLKQYLGDGHTDRSSRMPSPLGNGDVSVATATLGLRREFGVVVAASERAGFPDQTEGLILSVAANQASIGLQEARLLHEQKRIAEELDQRVARRTAELADANEELQRNRALLAEAQRLSQTGSFSWRVVTDEIAGSEELHRIFAFDPSERVTLDSIRSRTHPDDRQLLEDMIVRARGEARDFEYEQRLLMPDRSVKHLHLVAHAVRGVRGRLEYIGAVQDVTQQRTSEDALASARSELAHVARVASLSALTASIAHEINQPLAGIITNANTCLRMLASEPANVEGARETARRTIRDGNRASEVIEHLRALFSNKASATEQLDLSDTAREVIMLSLSRLQKGRVVLQTAFGEDLPPVAGDRVQLQEVIQNLLMNAADAMSDVNDRPRQLLIGTQRDGGDSVRLSVRDSGVGFSEQDAEKLFAGFYTTKADGMGIGLFISRSIIENHQGRIWAVRNSGPGATVSFSLPCKT